MPAHDEPSAARPLPSTPPVADALTRVVELDLTPTERAARGARDDRPWTTTMLGQRGGVSDLLRDISFLRPCARHAPLVVRRYREVAEQAFLWTREDGYRKAVRRWRRLAPIVASAKAVHCAMRYRKAVPRGSRSFLSQCAQMLKLARRGVRPWDYHRFGLYALEDERACLAVSLPEAVFVHLYLHRDVDFKAVDDKERLATALSAAGIATPHTACRVLRSTDAGELAAELPREDLFVKRTDFGWGIGAMGFDYLPDRGAWRGHDDVVRDPAALARHLCANGAEWDLLVQRRLRTGGSIRDLSPGGLCTARVVTLRPQRGASPMVLASVLRMPATAGDITDNFAGGGVAAPIDDRGTLGVGRMRTDCGRALAAHPATGGSITGRVMAEYGEVRELALAAHRLFPDILTVGWDIGLADGGPVVLEGNILWCAELMQCATRVPLLATPYGEAASAWLR